MKHVATALTVEDAISAIKEFGGSPADFVLRIPHSAIGAVVIDGSVVTGSQMALVSDHVLRKNWCPCGFVDEGDFRLYAYGEW